MICQKCGNEFRRKPSAMKREACKFCSRICWRSITLEERFWAKVKKTRRCWIWTGTTPNKYGMIRCPPMRPAHRVSWEIHYGPIPKDMCVLHRCDNPPCVRPDHLFIGTKKDNALDSVAKGRNVRRWWLTASDVRAIRGLHIPYVVTTKMLAKRFGVSAGHIQNILSRCCRSDII